jgi:hypothetical protein
MRLEQATQKDFEAIIAFYDDVTERTPDMAVYARWIKGKHPTQESIRTYIDEGSMYLYREEGGIVGAMAVTMYQGEDYNAIEWARQVGDDENSSAVECYKSVGFRIIGMDSYVIDGDEWKGFEMELLA